jgi:hypothetical protein
MHRCLFLLSFSWLLLSGCSSGTSSGTDSNIRTSPLGYTAALSQKDAKDLVAAGRNHDAVLAILYRIFPNPPWAKVLTMLILEHNEKFRKEVEAKNGAAGVAIDVWGLRRPEGDVGTGQEWYQSYIEKAILPESWHRNLEMSRAAQTIAVYWTVKSRSE